MSCRWPKKILSEWRGPSQLFGGVGEPLLAVNGATSRVQEVAEAECRIHDSFAKGVAVLRREGQGTVDAVAFPGEVKEGLMDLGRVVLDGGPKFGRECLVPEHKCQDNGPSAWLVAYPVRVGDVPRPTRVWGADCRVILGGLAVAWLAVP